MVPTDEVNMNRASYFYLYSHRLFGALSLLCVFNMHSQLLGEEEGRPVAQVDTTKQVEFNRDIVPILQRSCLACHSESESEGELIMETSESLQAGGDSGTRSGAWQRRREPDFSIGGASHRALHAASRQRCWRKTTHRAAARAIEVVD